MIEDGICIDEVKPMSEEMVHPIFKTEHRDIWYLTSNDQDYLSKEELKIFIAYYERMMNGGKLCFGYHIDKIEELRFSVY